MSGWKKRAAPMGWLLCMGLQMTAASAAPAEKSVTSTSSETAAQAAEQADSLSSTRHTLRIDGREYAYRADAGTLTIHDAKGRADAAFFHVAYTVEQPKGAAQRPLTFLFNGGPGSSSIWLQMGSIGPVRVQTADARATAPAPYRWQDNPQSLLDRSDLVFVDAIGTGYSKGLRRAGDGDEDPSKRFWGVDADIDAFARFVQAYVSQHQRWNSPKFLFGESYGTTRAAGLAKRLQDLGIETNGVVLMSSILNFGARLPGFDHEFVHTLPTFAAIAWHHRKVPGRSDSQEAFLQEVRDFARRDYAVALGYGNTLDAASIERLAQRLSAYTGISAEFWKSSNLRISVQRFRKELLRDSQRAVGRYDGRFLGIEGMAAGDEPDDDASSTAITGAFTAAFNDYLGSSLQYRRTDPYRIKAPLSKIWDWKHAIPGAQGPVLPVPLPVMTVDLAAAMRANPHLKVLSANGWYDLSTPFSAAEYDLAHMDIDASLRANISFSYYPSGHMMYLEPGSLVQLKQDLARFYDAATTRSD